MTLKKLLKKPIIDEFLTYLRALFFLRKKTKFVIFSQGRTGSTLLVDLLNNHPDIQCDDEILNVQLSGKRIFPILFVKAKANLNKKKVYGFKVKIYQLNNLNLMKSHPDQNKDPKKFLINLYKSGWKIIYLTRKNILRQVISSHIAEKRGSYHHRTTEGKLALPKMYIDPKEILIQIKNREGYKDFEEEILKHIPHLKIIYEEDLLVNKQKTLNKIFVYLGLDSYPVKSNLVRTSKKNLKDYIINYKELVKSISKTQYRYFLE